MHLMNLFELREHAKKMFGQSFDDDGKCFADAFLHGEYHEDRVDWHFIGRLLSKDALAAIWPAICHWLIAGSVNNRDGSGLKTLMDAHEAVIRWHRRELASPEDVFGPLAKVRVLIETELRAEKGAWREIAIYFMILDSGIHQSMGIHPIKFDQAYRSLEDLVVDDGKA